MIEIQPPISFIPYITKEDKYIIFVGGSIENNAAVNWQARFIRAFKDDDVLILNPRRKEWDSSWKAVASNKQFRKQVEWELFGLEACNAAIMYFDPATKSPISLLELGRFGSQKMHVVCPRGFWRKGNVDIVCERYNIPQHPNLKQAIAAIKANLTEFRTVRE